MNRGFAPRTYQERQQDLAKFRAQKIQREQNLAKARSWRTAAWTTSDVPYAKVRMQIEKEMSIKMPVARLHSIYLRYEAQAKKNPNDSLKQFAWANATYIAAAGLDRNVGHKLKEIETHFDQNVKFPGNYEFARIRFILNLAAWQMTDLRILGRRLLKHQPKDRFVIRYFIRTLYFRNPAEMREAKVWVNRMILWFPNEAITAYSQAHVYYGSWKISRNPEDARISIKAWKQHLDLLKKSGKPLTGWDRRWVEGTIAKLQKSIS